MNNQIKGTEAFCCPQLHEATAEQWQQENEMMAYEGEIVRLEGAISAVKAAYVRRQHEAGILMAAGARPAEEFESELNSLRDAIEILKGLNEGGYKGASLSECR